MVSKKIVDVCRFLLQNMIMIAVLYLILMFVGYTIFLGRLKMGDEVLGLSGLGAIFIGHGADGDFYSDDSHE